MLNLLEQLSIGKETLADFQRGEISLEQCFANTGNKDKLESSKE
ncbi:MAG: hypothetical protein ACK5Z5_06975 [Neisseriaceae bacterium]